MGDQLQRVEANKYRRTTPSLINSNHPTPANPPHDYDMFVDPLEGLLVVDLISVYIICLAIPRSVLFDLTLRTWF